MGTDFYSLCEHYRVNKWCLIMMCIVTVLCTVAPKLRIPKVAGSHHAEGLVNPKVG
jgi:hypothetical protein